MRNFLFSTKSKHPPRSQLKELLKRAKDSLLTAIRLAIAGNAIDFGVGSEFDLEQAIQR